MSLSNIKAPNSETSTMTSTTKVLSKDTGQEVYRLKREDIVWRNVLLFAYMHYEFFNSFWLLFTGQAKFSTFVFVYMYGYMCAFGVTMGAHRLWAHSSYRARWPLRAVLMVLNLTAFQNCIYDWVRDHRLHHKYTDTNADPHNYSRGFFFAHMGWLMVKKHPEVKRKGLTIPLDDLKRDRIVMWQKKYYLYLMPMFAFIIPTFVTYFVCNETLANSWRIGAMWRYVISLHLAWLVNSLAHSIGAKPYDKRIKPTENIAVAILAQGEGFHNYHHAFPWDYKNGELGSYGTNAPTAIIDFCTKIGWAYNVRSVSPELIKKRALRTGDGSIYSGSMLSAAEDEKAIWGWNDEDMLKTDQNNCYVANKIT